MAVPAMMSWNWPPITSVHASFKRFCGYGRHAEPLGGHGSFLGRLREQFVLAVPSLLIGLGRERAGRMVRQLKFALVTLKMRRFAWT